MKKRNKTGPKDKGKRFFFLSGEGEDENQMACVYCKKYTILVT